MTPAAEDALYEAFDNDNSVIGTRGAFLVAIRAAYAQGREDAAKVCERIDNENRATPGWREKRPEEAEMDDQRATGARQCAAAIRRGE